MRTSLYFLTLIFICTQLHAMEQQQEPPEPPILVKATFAIRQEVFQQFGALRALQHVPKKKDKPLDLGSVDAELFTRILDLYRLSVSTKRDSPDRIYEKLFRHFRDVQLTHSLVQTLDFLQANVENRFGAVLVLHCARIGLPVVSHLGKSYDDLPKTVQNTMPCGAFTLLNTALNCLLKVKCFILQSPPPALPPLAQEILRSKRSRSTKEIQILLREHKNKWQYLVFLPGIAFVNRLDLGENQLTAVPTEIGALTALQHLLLERNALTSLPPTIGLLTGLASLSLNFNKLTLLTENISMLTRLQDLQVCVNQLSSLPLWIGSLTQLTQLQVGTNKLTSLPATVGTLTKLENLNLGENRITSLPPEVGNASDLRTLSIDHNPLETLPSTISKLVRLQWLIYSPDQEEICKKIRAFHRLCIPPPRKK